MYFINSTVTLFILFIEHARNFQMYPRDLGSSFGKPYDYESVMHYSKFAFSKDRNIPTIVPTDDSATIGQRLGLSYYDREEINKLYKCQGEGSWCIHSENLLCRKEALPEIVS